MGARQIYPLSSLVPALEWFLDACNVHPAVSSAQGRSGAGSSWGAVGLVWGLGIVWVPSPRQWGSLMALPFLCELLTRGSALPSVPGNISGESSILFLLLPTLSVMSIREALCMKPALTQDQIKRQKNWWCAHCNLPSVCYCVPVCMYINLIKNHNTNNFKIYTYFFNTVIWYNYTISRRYLKMNYKVFSSDFWLQVRYWA